MAKQSRYTYGGTSLCWSCARAYAKPWPHGCAWMRDKKQCWTDANIIDRISNSGSLDPTYRVFIILDCPHYEKSNWNGEAVGEFITHGKAGGFTREILSEVQAEHLKRWIIKERVNFRNRQQLADFLGVSQTTVNNWLRGTRPSMVIIEPLAQKHDEVKRILEGDFVNVV